MTNPTLQETLSKIKNEKLRSFVSVNAYERGHSAGEDEIAGIAAGLADDLKDVDNLMSSMEREILELRAVLRHR